MTAPPAPASSDASHIGALATGGTLNFIGSATYGVLSFIVMLVLIRALGAARAGSFLQAIGIFTILGTTAVFGADTGLVRAVPQQLRDGRLHDVATTLRVALVPGGIGAFVMGAGVFFFSADLARLLTQGDASDEVAKYLRVLALFLPLYSLSYALLAATRGFATMVPGVVLDKLVRPLLQLLLLVAAVALGPTPHVIMEAWVSPLIVLFGGAALWLRRLLRHAATGEDVSVRTDPRVLFVEFWRFTLPRALASICRVTIQWLDVVLVGAMMSPRDAGIYAAATRLLVLGTFVSQALGQVSQPMFSRMLSGGENDTAEEIYRASTAWLIAATWPLFYAAALFGPVILSIFGRDFSSGAAALAILALTRLLGSGVGTADLVLLMGGRSTWSLANAVVALALNIVLNITLIPRYGIAGAALAWGAAGVVNNLAPLAQVSWLLKIHPFGVATAAAAAATTISFGLVGLLVRAFLGQSVLALCVYAVAAAALFLALVVRWRKELDLERLLTALRNGRRVARNA